MEKIHNVKAIKTFGTKKKEYTYRGKERRINKVGWHDLLQRMWKGRANKFRKTQPRI